MTKGTVYGFGEIVYDIIFKNNKIIKGQPGGSVLNALINLSFLKCKTSLISAISNDELGKTIRRFILEQKVKTNFLEKVAVKTKIALAFLNYENNADYIFYNDNDKSNYFSKIPDFKPGDVFLFGSSAAIEKNNRKYLSGLLKSAKNSEAIVYYDPNIRKSVIDKYPAFNSIVLKNIAKSDIVRGSKDDFFAIFETIDYKIISKKVARLGNPVLIITDADKPVVFFLDGKKYEVKFRPVKAISAIGAGDAFNSGFIQSMLLNKIQKNDLRGIDYKTITGYVLNAVSISSEVCLSTGNYIIKS